MALRICKYCRILKLAEACLHVELSQDLTLSILEDFMQEKHLEGLSHLCSRRELG